MAKLVTLKLCIYFFERGAEAFFGLTSFVCRAYKQLACHKINQNNAVEHIEERLFSYLGKFRKA